MQKYKCNQLGLFDYLHVLTRQRGLHHDFQNFVGPWCIISHNVICLSSRCLANANYPCPPPPP